jgi:hypothetical protein
MLEVLVVPSINIDNCVQGCTAEPTHFYWIGEPDTGVLAATCDEHTNRVGLCTWYADVREITREEAIILAVLRI